MASKKPSVKEVLERQVAEVLPSRKGLASLMKRKKIRLYLGIDPTGGNLHLGHTIGLRKLQQFQDLGHEAILVVGTGTVLAGDPSQRETARASITKKEIEKNIATWKAQAGKILDFKKVKIKKNGEWLTKLSLTDVLEIASNVSAVQLFQRDMFQRRTGRGDTVWTHEILYPLLQGYDSVAMDVDLELGGTDQVFNMLVGRELQRKMRNKEKYVLTFPMIMGLDGEPMSKSSGNTVNIADAPKDMYGKLMSLRDGLVPQYFELLTTIPRENAKKLKEKLSARDFKAALAKEIVAMYHGRALAERAEKEFARVFREKQLPSGIKKVQGLRGKKGLVDILVKTHLASSNSDAKRLIEQGGVRINGAAQKDAAALVQIKKGDVIQVGKRRFVKAA